MLLVSIGATAQTQQKPSSQLAYEYYNDQEWRKAGAIFLELYEENGVKPYLNNYIRCMVQLQDYKTAEKTLDRIIRKTGDQSLNIDLAYLNEIQGKKELADEQYLIPMKKFPQTAQEIKSLGSNYLHYARYEYAQQVYEIGRRILNNPDEFHLEMGSLFMLQRNYPSMLDEYFELLVSQPRYLRTVQIQINSTLTRDIDETLLENAKTKILTYIQNYPGLDVFTEMLIWVYLQENDFDRAIDLATALDRRNREPGDRILELARTAGDAKVFPSAIKAYEALIAKGPQPEVNQETRNVVSRQAPWRLAKQEILSSELSMLEAGSSSKPNDYRQLAEKYDNTLTELGLDYQNVYLLKELAYIHAYRIGQPDSAISIIDKALETPRISRVMRSEILLDKADIILIQGDPWEATFLYAQVEKENTENPIGSLAKFKKAMLAYYTGNFDWAKMQLDVLKGSTSKLIANDAFEVSLLIRENQDPLDSLNSGLAALSRADYLYFQKKTDSALIVLDSLIKGFPTHSITDDALFRQAEIYLAKNREDDAFQALEKISSEFLYDIWGHKALFYMGKIHDSRNEKEKAIDYYQQVLDQFPNSFYSLDARNRIRILQGDKTENSNGST